MKDKYDFSKGKRGAIDRLPRGKTQVNIHIDDAVLEWFKAQVHAAGGGNYQTLINQALREYVQDRKQPLEKILRRIVREELSEARGTNRKRVTA